MPGEPWQLAESFLKDFLRDAGGTFLGGCRGNLRGCRGNLGGTLGEPRAALFLMISRGMPGEPSGEMPGEPSGMPGEPSGNLGGTFS